MIKEGQIVLFQFPQADHQEGKLRPALVIPKLPGIYDDWLICMITTRLDQGIADFDEIITPNHTDYLNSGLKQASLIRIGRLAVVSRKILLGMIGHISSERLSRIKQHLAQWIHGTE